MVGAVREPEALLAVLPTTRSKLPVGVPVKVLLVLGVTFPLPAPLPVPVGLIDPVPLPLLLIARGILCDGALGERVLEGEAPREREEVGDTDTVPLAVPVALEVGVPVLVPLEVGEGVKLGLWDELGV